MAQPDLQQRGLGLVHLLHHVAHLLQRALAAFAAQQVAGGGGAVAREHRAHGVQLAQACLGRLGQFGVAGQQLRVVDDQDAQVGQVAARLHAPGFEFGRELGLARQHLVAQRELGIGDRAVDTGQFGAHLLGLGDQARGFGEAHTRGVGQPAAHQHEQRGRDEAAQHQLFDAAAHARRPVLVQGAGQQMRGRAQQDEGPGGVQRHGRHDAVGHDHTHVPQVADERDDADAGDQGRCGAGDVQQARASHAGGGAGQHHQGQCAVGRHAAARRVVGVAVVAEQELVEPGIPVEQVFGQCGQAQQRHGGGQPQGGARGRTAGQGAQPQRAGTGQQPQRRVGLHLHGTGDHAAQRRQVEQPARQHHEREQRRQRAGQPCEVQTRALQVRWHVPCGGGRFHGWHGKPPARGVGGTAETTRAHRAGA